MGLGIQGHEQEDRRSSWQELSFPGCGDGALGVAPALELAEVSQCF